MTENKKSKSFLLVPAGLFLITLGVILGGIRWANQTNPSIREAKEKCKQDFTDASLVEEIVPACTLVIDSEPDDRETLLEARLARAQAYAVQKNYRNAETDFDEAFSLADLDSKSPNAFTSHERQIAFLADLWPEHLELVRDNTGKCQAASDAYKTSMSAYSYAISDRELEVENDELLILLELGHFLSNRERAWNIALDYYEFILDIDPNHINARLSLVHAHLMSIENSRAAKASDGVISGLLTQIENDSQDREEIQVTVLYHRGSLLAKQGDYKGAIEQYDKILGEYSSGLDNYPLLEFIAIRDKAFALFADGDDSSDTAFNNALVTLSNIDNISDEERNSRRAIIENFQENNGLLESYIDVGFAFSELVVHDFEAGEHAFIEAGHGKFYGCYRG